MPQVVRARIQRRRPAIAGRQVLQELDSGTRLRFEPADTHSRSEHIIEMLLFGAVVFALACKLHFQNILVELQAALRVRYRDRRVIDTQKKTPVGLLPLRIPFARRSEEHTSELQS